MFMRVLAMLVLAAFLPGPMLAADLSGGKETSKPAVSRWIDPGWRRTLARYDVRFEDDGTRRTVFDFEILLTDSKGLQSVAQQVYGYNSFFDNLTVSDLATVKADGRVIPVDPRAVNDQPAFANPQSPYFDESRIVTISYPDVAPGDKVKGRLVYSSKKAEFPGAFAHVWAQPQDRPPETIDLTLNGPASRPLRINAIGVEHSQEQVGARIVHHVRFHHQAPRELYDAASDFDSANRFEVSTFANYASFAAIVREWNAPMAVPDAEIRRLSQDIVGDASDDRVKAERIFNWVAKNIRYVGIGFADGGFVSQPVDAIIRARYGDCKAHVTVLKSLLAAQGIAADFVVVNLGSRYTIPAVATPSFDHAIVYLPKFDLYVDPTASMSSFGALPSVLYGKPVLDVDRGVVSSIPPAKAADFVVRTDTSIKFDSEGGRTGVSTLSGSGIGAALTRAYAAHLETRDMRLTAERELQRDGFEGTGSYAFTDPRAGSNPYTLTASFELTRAVDLKSKSNIRLFVNSDPRPSAWELMTNNVRDRPFRCLPLDYTESSTIELPKSLNLAEIPLSFAENRDLKGETRYGTVRGHVSIEGRVALEGRTVRATNRVTAVFDAAVCPAEFSANIKAFMRDIWKFRDGQIKLTPDPVARVLERGSAYYVGVTAYRAGNYDAALRTLRPIAEQGDSDAQVSLGTMYREGHGVAQDDAQAVAWYRKAAERNNPEGLANLAFMYGSGRGVARDQVEAARWLRKSAELGNDYAQCTLADMYRTANGIAQNYGQARLWYTKAAEQGDSRAAYSLATMYEQGVGGAADYGQANVWYRKAADKGYVLAEVNLGKIYSDGRGVERDYTQAVQWFRKAADQGNAVGEYNMGYAYEAGLGVKADAAAAKQWYARAARQGYGAAQQRLNSLEMQRWAGIILRITRIFR